VDEVTFSGETDWTIYYNTN